MLTGGHFVISQVTTIKTVKQMDELVDMGEGTAWHQKWKMKLTALFNQVV